MFWKRISTWKPQQWYAGSAVCARLLVLLCKVVKRWFLEKRNWQPRSLCLKKLCARLSDHTEHDVWMRLAHFGFGRCFSAWVKGFHDWVRLYSLHLFVVLPDFSLCCAKFLPKFQQPHMNQQNKWAIKHFKHALVHSSLFLVLCLYLFVAEQQMWKSVCLETSATCPAFSLIKVTFDAALRSSSILMSKQCSWCSVCSTYGRGSVYL